MGRRDANFASHVRKLLQEFEISRDLSEGVQTQIADVVTHTSRKDGQILFRQGDLPNECYIILSGKVQVWQKQEEGKLAKDVDALKTSGNTGDKRRSASKQEDCAVVDARHGEEDSTLKWHAEAILSILRKEQGVNTPDGQRLPGKSRRKEQKQAEKKAFQGWGDADAKWGHVATVGVGRMVGEAGLLDDHPRNATLRCQTPCEFLAISKEDFDRVLKAAMNRVRFQQLAGPMRQFLKEYNFYKSLNADIQMRVAEILQFVKYKEGCLIVREGDEARFVQIILSGEVTAWMSGVPMDQEPTPLDPGCNVFQNMVSCVLYKLQENQVSHGRNGKRSSVIKQADWVEPEECDTRTLGRAIAYLGSGQHFGPGVLSQTFEAQASVTCTTDVQLIRVDKFEMQKLVQENLVQSRISLPCLIQPLIEMVPFCQNTSKSVQADVAFAMRYVNEPRDKVLFFEGDPPGDCYFVLSGKVTVWRQPLPSTKRKSKLLVHTDTSGLFLGSKPPLTTGDRDIVQKCKDVEAALKAARTSQDIGRAGCSSKDQVLQQGIRRTGTKTMADEWPTTEESHDNEDDDQDEGDANTLLVNEMMGFQVCSLGQGTVVGDQALMNAAPRTATVTCESECHLLVLSRLDFDRFVKADMLRAQLKQHASVVKRLLKEYPLFKDLEIATRDRVSESVHFIPMRKGQVVFEHGEDANFCYWILEGEVTVWDHTTPAEGKEKEDEVEDEDADKDADESEPKAVRTTSLAMCDEEESQVCQADSEGGNRRPPITPTSLLSREKCAALAAVLGTMSKDGLSTLGKWNCINSDDAMAKASYRPLDALGPGSIFGELALMNNNPRNATVSCYTDCSFLAMKKADFDCILRSELQKVKDKKLDFLRGIIPGIRNLPTDTVDRIMYYFTQETVPRNHTFFEQGQVLDGSIYFIWQGSAESYMKDSATGGFLRRGIMLQGSIFAAVPQGTRAPISVVSTSCPCEVLHVKPEGRKHLPECVIRSLREVLDQTIQRRSTQCLPLAPMGSAFASHPAGTQGKNKQLSPSRCGRVPRPLSGKFLPPVTQGRQNILTGGKASQKSRTCALPNFKGLFQMHVTEVEHEAFELDPGQTLAMLAKKPRRRERRNLPTSQSLPALRAASHPKISVEHEAFELDPGQTLAMLAKKPRRRERRNLPTSQSLRALRAAAHPKILVSVTG